jgi:uncharacterized membrane protein
LRLGRLLSLVLVLALIPTVHAQVSPQTLGFIVYTDGVTRVDYHLDADPTQALVNITLFGDTLEGLFILDQDGLLLASTVVDGSHQVDSLGSSSLTVSYLTVDLTGKSGAVWSINVETPISAEIMLPVGATIINMNDIPLEIETVDEQTRLVMPAGGVSVSYTVDIVDSETLASEAIDEVETVIQQAEDNGVIVSDAAEALSEARSYFEAQDYMSAQEKADEALSLVVSITAEAATAQAQINAVQEAIEAALDTGKTVGIDEAEERLAEALVAYGSGEYDEAVLLSQKALELIIRAEAPWSGYNSLIMMAGGAVIIGVVVALALRSRQTREIKPLEDVEIDLETLFEEHPELVMSDKEVLRFMAERGGEAFAMEIRERFDIPRTSTWRMIQRFIRYELVEEKKIGGQSLVTIVDRYRRAKR